MSDMLAGGLGGLAGSVQGTVNSAVSQGTGILDKYFPPETRATLWAKFNKFMTERPKLGAFLLSQIALSGVPLGLFVIMTITVAIFAIIAALLIGLLGALVFIVFAIGFALIILLPTLFFTTAVATFLFLFGLGAYYIVKWFNEKEIPGIHTDLVGGIKKQLLDNSELTEEEKQDPLGGPAPSAAELNEKSQNKPPQTHQEEKPRKLQNGSTKKKEGGGGAANGVTKPVEGATKPIEGATKPVDGVAKSTGLDKGPVGDVKKKVDVGNASKTVDGVKGAVPGGVL